MTLRSAYVFGFFALYACARTPDGMLGALYLPNNARPAMVRPSDTFVVEAQQAGELTIKNDSAEIPVSPEWKSTPLGTFTASIAVPADASVGVYTVEWLNGDEADRNARALYVLERNGEQDAFSQQYSFACIACTRGGTYELPESMAQTSPQFIVAFVDTAEEEFANVLTALDAWSAPTVVVANAPKPVCKRWFGPATFAFQYGPDAYLAPELGRAGIGDDVGYVAGQLAELRAGNKTARWSVGLFAGPDPSMSMRTTMSLFIDDTLHACIFAFADETRAIAKLPKWAGWFEAPRVFSVTASRPVVFRANRKAIAIQKAPAEPAKAQTSP